MRALTAPPSAAPRAHVPARGARRASRRAVPVVLVAGLALAGCAGAAGGADAVGAIAAISAPEAEDLPCGHLFARVAADQTSLLVVEAVGGTRPDPGTVQLDGVTWRAELRLGEDLAANWCDDVVEPGEPEPVVTATYPVAGTLTWTVDGPECAAASGEASGVVVDLGDDGVVNVGTLSLANPQFGCFAG